MLKHDVEEHMNISPMAFCNEIGKLRQAIERIAWITDIGGLNGEEIRRVVSPAEHCIVRPRDPRHEFNRIDIQSLEQVQLVLNRIDRCADPTILLGKVVNHQFINNQGLRWQPLANGRHAYRRASNDKGRALFGITAVFCAGIAHEAYRGVIKANEVLVLIPAIRQGRLDLKNKQIAVGMIGARHLESAGRIPVRGPRVYKMLEVADDAYGCNMTCATADVLSGINRVIGDKKRDALVTPR